VLNIVNFKKKQSIIFFLTIAFGLIHGLGFSSLLKNMLGNEESILIPLFSLNLGIEIGQLLIVILSLLFSYILVIVIKIKKIYYINCISLIIFAIAIFMSIYRF
jgi:hypothetical protein